MRFLDSLVLAYQNGYDKAGIDLQLRYLLDDVGSEEEVRKLRRELEGRDSFLRDRRKSFGLFERIAFKFGYRGYRNYLLREFQGQVESKVTKALTENIEDCFKSDEGKL